MQKLFTFKNFLMYLVLTIFAVLPAECSEMPLSVMHFSIAGITDGHSDFSDARFNRVEIIGSGGETLPDGTLTLSGGNYSYWDGRKMQKVAGESKTFKLRDDGTPIVSENTPVYFMLEADGGMNGVNFSWNFPDAPSLNGSGTIPAFRTTQEQLNSFVPYMEYVYSGDNVSGVRVRIVNPSDVSLPVPQSQDVRFSVNVEYYDEIYYGDTSRRYASGGGGLSFHAGETPEDVITFERGDLTGSPDRVYISLTKGDSTSWWIFSRTFNQPEPFPDIRHITDAMLVDGKSDYSHAKFRGVSFALHYDCSNVEARYLSSGNYLKIPGGGYTLKDNDTREEIKSVLPGQDMSFSLRPYAREHDMVGLDYELFDSEGRKIVFAEDTETGLNGRRVTWTFPDTSEMNVSATVPNFRSVEGQLKEFVPYIELVMSGDTVAGVKYRLVKSNDTNVAVSPTYPVDVKITVWMEDGTSSSSRWQMNTAFYNMQLASPMSGTVKRVVVRYVTHEDPENACLYSWNFQVSSASKYPKGTIQPIKDLSSQVLNNIVSAVDGISSVSDIRYVSAADIGAIYDPTDEMTQAVKDDSHEIIGAMNSLKVSQSGWYVMRLTLSDELYALLKNAKVSDIKTYSLSDSKNVNASLITGLLNTWELLSLTGEKVDTIGARELLMVGFLEAGQSFSMFLAKLILALVAGGCSSFMHGTLLIVTVALCAMKCIR